jgi:hypothetical protein
MGNAFARPVGPRVPDKETVRGDEVAAAVRDEFPWVNVQRIAPGTGDVILGYGKAISQRELRKLQDAGDKYGYYLFEEKGQPPRLIPLERSQGKNKGRK